METNGQEESRPLSGLEKVVADLNTPLPVLRTQRVPVSVHAKVFGKAILTFMLYAVKDSLLYGFGRLLGMGKDKVLDRVGEHGIEKKAKSARWGGDMYEDCPPYDEQYY